MFPGRRPERRDTKSRMGLRSVCVSPSRNETRALPSICPRSLAVRQVRSTESKRRSSQPLDRRWTVCMRAELRGQSGHCREISLPWERVANSHTEYPNKPTQITRVVALSYSKSLAAKLSTTSISVRTYLRLRFKALNSQRFRNPPHSQTFQARRHVRI